MTACYRGLACLASSSGFSTSTDEHLVPPVPAPNLNVPPSQSTVKVSVIDSTSRIDLPMTNFLQPDYSGHPRMLGPSVSFLIEHESQKPILFDLGIRKDWEALPKAAKWKEMGWGVKVDKDVATILKDNGVDVDGGAIASIILSHHHWDHVGDCSTFPSSTEIVVGPDFLKTHLPGYPTDPNSSLIGADLDGKKQREIDFNGEPKGPFKIGRFKAHDFFGDGSFYLLDTPGHSIGHICGLARTSSNPDSFIFMGGDASHHGGEFRPTAHSPIPKHIKPSPLKRRAGICPGHLFQEIHPDVAANKPFYHVTASFADDKKVADWTIDGLGEFDGHPNVLMLMAHDDAVVDPPQFEFYPKSLNDWLEKGIKEKTKWLFLGDFEGGVDAKEKGEAPYTWGKYP